MSASYDVLYYPEMHQDNFVSMTLWEHDNVLQKLDVKLSNHLIRSKHSSQEVSCKDSKGACHATRPPSSKPSCSSTGILNNEPLLSAAEAYSTALRSPKEELWMKNKQASKSSSGKLTLKTLEILSSDATQNSQ